MNRDELIEAITPRMVEGFPPGIYCDDGWLPLISDLYEELVKIDPNFRIAQVKEKLGGLRFYANPSTECLDQELFYQFLREAEVRSYQICELTGKPGTLMRRGSWLKTLDPETAPEGYEIDR